MRAAVAEPADDGAGLQLEAAVAVHVALDAARDEDVGRLDARLHDGALGDRQLALADDVALHVALDAQVLRGAQRALDGRVTVEERRLRRRPADVRRGIGDGGGGGLGAGGARRRRDVGLVRHGSLLLAGLCATGSCARGAAGVADGAEAGVAGRRASLGGRQAGAGSGEGLAGRLAGPLKGGRAWRGRGGVERCAHGTPLRKRCSPGGGRPASRGTGGDRRAGASGALR